MRDLIVVSNPLQDLAAVSEANGGGVEEGAEGEPGETPEPGIVCGYTGLLC